MFSKLKQSSKDTAHTIRLAVQVAWKTGLLPYTIPSAVVMLVDSLARGRASPSTLYRLQALSQPRKVALRWRHRTYTFCQIDDEIDRLATGLKACGVPRGASTILMLKNRPEFILAQPAMSRMGSAGVSISWRSTPAELAWLATHSQAKAILFDHDVAGTVRDALPELKQIPRDRMFSVGGRVQGFPTYEQLISARAGRLPDAGGEAAVIVYTSGTTGRPKAALRKFPRDVVQGTLNVISVAPLRTDDVHLAVLPFYHSTAFAFTSFSHLVGACVVILDEFTPEGFLRAVQEHHVTQTAVVPTLLHRVCRLGADVVRRYDTTSLRAIITAGAPLSAPLASEAMDLLGEVLYNFYGATETGLNTMASPADLRQSPGTIGRLVPGNEIRLLDDDGREVAPGEVGELYARSGLMVSGYLGDEASTRASQRDGFFSVGDLARVDARGCYHIAGRKRDMIISGGVNVYPAEVEAVVESHPDVAEAAVVGEADEEWGERVRAFVVLRDGVHPEHAITQIDAYCRKHLMGPKLPREFVVLEALPRNPTGKVLKDTLRHLGMPAAR
ncbi:MAG: AMP-binding protein [Deltaproteobacteria bacterium]|nr:AMP-binding protein [Deltaproteobacteria bacterium]